MMADHNWVSAVAWVYETFDWKCERCGQVADGDEPPEGNCPGRAHSAEPEQQEREGSG